MASIRDKLKRLRSSSESKPKPEPVKETGKLDGHLPGNYISTAFGSVYTVKGLPEDNADLQKLQFPISCDVLAAYTRLPELPDWVKEKVLFIDTETTGLAGGSGSYIIMMGIGKFVDYGFTVTQYILEDPSMEYAFLEQIAADLKQASSTVSFNGKSYDIPLMKTRFILHDIEHNTRASCHRFCRFNNIENSH